MEPGCPHAPPCPGCPLIDRPYAEQLAHKRARVVAELRRFPSLAAVPVDAPLATPRPFGYRTRARLPVAGGAIGLYAAGTHEVVDLPRCRVLAPPLAEAAEALRGWLSAHHLGAPAGPVRYVELRADDEGRVGVTLVVGAAAGVEWPVAALRIVCPRIVALAVNENPVPDRQILGPNTHHVWGERRMTVRFDTHRVPLSPGVFSQANPAVLAQVHELMRAHFTDRGAVLLDLFAGAGAHAFALADLAEQVIAVEEVGPAVADGIAAAAALGLSHLRFVTGTVEAVLRDRLPDLPEGPLLTVLNPSRRGVRPEALETLATLSPTRLAYLSCEPFTLARDLDLLVRAGFAIDRVVPLDMLPQTDHVETLALLTRGEQPPPPPDLPAFGPCRDLWPPLPRGVSGAALEREHAAATTGAPSKWLALVRGVPRKGGTLPTPRGRPPVRHRRIEVLGGHTLLRLEAADHPAEVLMDALRRLGHPVIGAGPRGHGPTDRYFEEKLYLVRPFLHRERIEDATAPLPAELVAVLERLRAR